MRILLLFLLHAAAQERRGVIRATTIAYDSAKRTARDAGQAMKVVYEADGLSGLMDTLELDLAAAVGQAEGRSAPGAASVRLTKVETRGGRGAWRGEEEGGTTAANLHITEEGLLRGSLTT